MADPKFTDRAALEAWVAERASKARNRFQHGAFDACQAIVEQSRRVTPAHTHLEEK